MEKKTILKNGTLRMTTMILTKTPIVTLSTNQLAAPKMNEVTSELKLRKKTRNPIMQLYWRVRISQVSMKWWTGSVLPK